MIQESEKQIKESIELLNNKINYERNNIFGRTYITIPLPEARKILEILEDLQKGEE